jgi:isocitrate dehydrogenase
LIDDMVASALQVVWRVRVGVQELRRRRQSDQVAQGFGSLGLMTSV